MKRLLVCLLLVGVVGCGEKEELTKTNKENNKSSQQSGETAAAQQVYDNVAATPESVVGTFVINEDSEWASMAYGKFVLQDNGVIRTYAGGVEYKWYINDAGEIRVKDYPELKFKVTSNGHLITFGEFGEIEYKRVKDTKIEGITDPILDTAIREALGTSMAWKPAGITDEHGYEHGDLTQTDLENVTELYLSGNKLTDVKGLEKLTQ